MAARLHGVSRLEGFSDAVFGFALTLLVVSLDVPDTIDELEVLVRGSLPFALMFAMVCYIWWEHNKFFRRYGLQDAWTAFLNCVLLFVVLFYVYPLKFLTVSLARPQFRHGRRRRCAKTRAIRHARLQHRRRPDLRHVRPAVSARVASAHGAPARAPPSW